MKIPEVVVGEDVPESALKMRNEDSWNMNVLQKKQTIAAYLASVQFMDQQVGRLLDALDQLELRDKTIVVFLSDHGYNLGEHDCWAKSSLWEGTTRVPLIISYPENKENHGHTYEAITELIDLYPTLSELCNLSDREPDLLQGASHADFIKDNKKNVKNASAYTTTYKGNAASIRTDKWRYTRWGKDITDLNEELYSHDHDPEELDNLAYEPKFKKKLKEMRTLFELHRSKATK